MVALYGKKLNKKENKMIVITGHDDYRITIEGHANYAPPGQDIVCASVSTLVQVLIKTI